MTPGTRIIIAQDCRKVETATGQVAIYEGHFKYSEAFTSHPRFVLDDGSKIWGIECWWIEETEVLNA